MLRTGEPSQKQVGASLGKLWLSGLRHTRHCLLSHHCGQLDTTYSEKADAPVTGGRREVLIIVKVNVAQAPGVRKLLTAPIKNPRTAQVPAW